MTRTTPETREHDQNRARDFVVRALADGPLPESSLDAAARLLKFGYGTYSRAKATLTEQHGDVLALGAVGMRVLRQMEHADEFVEWDHGNTVFRQRQAAGL